MASVRRKTMKPIAAIFFDLDGVLIDATEWHYEAFRRALGDIGIHIGRDFHDKLLNGLPTYKKLEVMNIWGSRAELVADKKYAYTNELIEERCKPDKEKVALLKALKRRGYSIAVCSNAITESAYRMLERAGLLPYVDRTYGNTDVELPKPNPEIYLKAMNDLGVTADETLIIEDSAPGIEAAKASMAHVKVTPGYHEVTREFLKEYL